MFRPGQAFTLPRPSAIDIHTASQHPLCIHSVREAAPVFCTPCPAAASMPQEWPSRKQPPAQRSAGTPALAGTRNPVGPQDTFRHSEHAQGPGEPCTRAGAYELCLLQVCQQRLAYWHHYRAPGRQFALSLQQTASRQEGRAWCRKRRPSGYKTGKAC